MGGRGDDHCRPARSPQERRSSRSADRAADQLDTIIGPSSNGGRAGPTSVGECDIYEDLVRYRDHAAWLPRFADARLPEGEAVRADFGDARNRRDVEAPPSAKQIDHAPILSVDPDQISRIVRAARHTSAW